MTTFAMDRIALRSPDALLAALPYLLGFHPTDSAVLVWMRARRLVLTQRIDLPADPRVLPAWTSAVWNHEAAALADEVALVIVSAMDADPSVVAAVSDDAAARGIAVRDVLHLRDGRWRSLLCGDPTCCPPEGRLIDPGAAAAVGAEFTFEGRAPVADRGCLTDEFAADEDATEPVAARLADASPDPARLERWRDQRIRRIEDLLLARAPLDADSAADVVSGFGDVRVRDTLLWEAARWPVEAAAQALTPLACAVRSAPPGTVAPVATVAALVAWLAGDGARARAALDRARGDDPGYSLALLLAASVEAGMSPALWRQSMSALTRADCRHGTSASA